MTTFKFTGKNGGDPGEYWRSIKIAAEVQVSDALKGGRYLIQKVRSLTARGVDYAGVPFERYTPAHAKRKGSDVVNLSMSGRMLAALKISVNGRVYDSSARGTSKETAFSMSVGIYNNDKQAMKGNVHNEGYLKRGGSLRGSVRRMPKRRWLDATRGTVQEVNNVMGESLAARVKDAI